MTEQGPVTRAEKAEAEAERLRGVLKGLGKWAPGMLPSEISEIAKEALRGAPYGSELERLRKGLEVIEKEEHPEHCAAMARWLLDGIEVVG